MVTFELFARPMLEALAGQSPRKLQFLHARLKKEIRVKTGLKRFLPAMLSGEFESSRSRTWSPGKGRATSPRRRARIAIS